MATICSTGHRILARVRSHKKLRVSSPEAEKPLHRRQRSDPSDTIGSISSSTTSDAYRRGHYPPIEWDPLKLNPPLVQVPRQPMRQHDSFQGRTLRTKRSFGGHELCRPRMHHSDSGFSIDIHEGFDFGFEKQKALERELRMNRSHHKEEAAVNLKGWSSPASSTDSEGSWFHDDDDEEDDDESVKRAARLFGDLPTLRPRPQVGSDNDIKRGEWKRRGIVFGGQSNEEVYVKEEDAFDWA